PNLRLDLIRKILAILEHNPYAQVFKSLGVVPNLDEYRISLNTDIKLDQRRYNAPTTSQVAAIWVEGSDPQKTFDRSVIMYGKGERPLYIRAYYGCYDPLSYPLFFPRGEIGWNRLMPYIGAADDTNQDLVDDTGLVDTVIAGESRGDRIGKRIVLPRTFPGGDRDMQRRFLDAMAIVQRWGKPDYFVTMTCNPYWEEITIELLPGQLPQDRPDLVARVYRAKQRSMMDLLIKGKHFGEVAAYVHVTEFQKRGLPHEHILLIMKAKSKLRTPDDYDRVISAEIPDKKKYPVLHDLVVKHMLHGPCGALKKSCPCMIDGQCRFHYPRDFCDATLQGKDSYPIYRRRDDGVRVRIRGADLDNRWVVPYNPFLLMTYNCHINVEACSSIKA
uniref:Helitron helicase-like domain-containing protein n=1 Tax=Aegilops tauschii subsp. strangulata TaxID=200361 RepID=A0A453RUC3_AEGTS